jgi:hypothetical protein
MQQMSNILPRANRISLVSNLKNGFPLSKTPFFRLIQAREETSANTTSDSINKATHQNTHTHVSGIS